MGSILAATAMSAFALGSGATSTPAEAALPPQDIVSDTIATYAIPAGSMAGALTAFAEKNHLHLLYDARTTRHLRSPGLVGSHSLREGLDRLLSGTGFTYRFADVDGGVSIVLAQADNGVRNDSGAEALPAIDIGAERPATGEPGGEGGKALTPQNSYVTPVISTGTKTDVPVMNTPVNVQEITQKAIEDQQATSLGEALRNVSGVTVPGGIATGQLSTTTSGIYVRGFQTREFYQDGFRVNGSNGYNLGLDLVAAQQFANISSIEVLKGPAAILYGLSQPGGIINITTRGPLDTPHYTVQQQIGSLARYRTSLAATGPVTADKSVLYRVDMSYDDNGAPKGYFMDRTHGRNFFVAPVVKWQIDNDNWLKLETSYSNNLVSQYAHLVPMINGSFLPISRSTNFNDYLPVLQSTFNAAMTGEHKFDADWMLRSRVAFSSSNSSLAGPVVGSAQTPGPGLTVSTNGREYRTLNSSWTTNQDLVGHFDLLGTKNTLLLGGDYYRLTYASTQKVTPWGYRAVSELYPIYPGIPVTGGLANITALYNRQDTAGLYVQEQLELPYNVHVMAGARYQYVFNWNTSSNGSIGFLPGPMRDNGVPAHQARVTPRYGLLWRPREWVSLYGNYTEGFAANTALIYPNTLAPAQNAMSWEAGAKFELFDGMLRANADYYYLLKTNLPIADPDPTHICGTSTTGGCSLLIGAARSEGVEVDVKGRLAPGWDVIVAYTNQDVRIASAPNNANTNGFGANGESGLARLTPGQRYPNVARNLARLWTTYEFQDEWLKGMTIGAGYTYRGSMPIYDASGTYPNAPLLPSYGTVDLMASYTFDLDGVKTTAQVNANNIFDRNYYTAGWVTGKPSPTYNVTNSALDPGSPFNIMGSLKFEF
ncbi:MAG TPA: TonB-dependent receptor [Methylosinus sp.]|uniref:TonB-dependent siderophore receptor n=1 Tax=Methylosinus sp. TaxID=427 RepID=UPI002F93BFAB